MEQENTIKRTTWEGKNLFDKIPSILRSYSLREDIRYKCVNGSWSSCRIVYDVVTPIGIKSLLVLGILKPHMETGTWFSQPIKATTIEKEDSYAQRVFREYRIKSLPI